MCRSIDVGTKLLRSHLHRSSSRHPPPPSLVRLRINGLIEVIEPGALRMTLDEAEGLIRQRGLDLATARVETMLRRVEGWTAGLILLSEASADYAASETDMPDVLFDYLSARCSSA